MRRLMLLAAVVCLAPFTAKAQDLAKVDPKHCKVEFENAQVHVLRWNTGPHEKIPMHGRPALLTAFLTDNHVKFTLPDGKTRESHQKAGETAWSAAEKHSAESLGDKPSELIQVELKAQPAAAKPAAAKKKKG